MLISYIIKQYKNRLILLLYTYKKLIINLNKFKKKFQIIIPFYYFSNDINYFIDDIFDELDFVFKKLIQLCTKKGNKKKAYKLVINSLKIIRSFFYYDPLLLIKNTIYKIQPFIFLQKVIEKRKEIIYPQILNSNTQISIALRRIIKDAYLNRYKYKKIYLSFVYSIIENCLLKSEYIKKMKEDNFITKINKYQIEFMRKKRRLPKFRLIRKIKKNIYNER